MYGVQLELCKLILYIWLQRILFLAGWRFSIVSTETNQQHEQKKMKMLLESLRLSLECWIKSIGTIYTLNNTIFWDSVGDKFIVTYRIHIHSLKISKLFPHSSCFCVACLHSCLSFSCFVSRNTIPLR